MTDIIKRRFFFVVIGILTIILVLCLSFWGYMQVNLFEPEDYSIKEKPIENYLSSLESGFIHRTQDNLFTGFIPMSVINNELSYRIEEATQSMNIITEGVIVNADQKWIKINYRKHITIPVYHDMIIYKKEEGLSVELVPIAFGKKQTKLPTIISQWIFDALIVKPIKVQLNYAAYKPGDYFEYTSSNLTNEGLFLNYELYIDDMEMVLENINTSANDGLVNIYEAGTEYQQEALRFLREYHVFPENIMGLIYEDYHLDAQVITSLLILADLELFDSIIERYPMLSQRINREDILDQRAELLNQATIKYGRNVLKKFEQMEAVGNIVSHYGYFFDLDRMEPVTIELIVDLNQLKIPYDDFKQMRLIMIENEPYVLYDTDEERYLLINERSYSLISEEEYKNNYFYERPSKGDYTNDPKTYDAIYGTIEDALGEEIFIRYMKDDGVDAFVVYSSRLNDQDFTVALLKNEGNGYKLIGNGLTSIKEINREYPDFNLNLITRRIETTKVKILNSTTRHAIKEGLVEYGYIDEDEIIPYVSYDGNYIAVMTGTGEQYIYTIYRDTFLDRVYTLDDAFEIFDDINPLLLIQERPVG